MYVQEHAGHRIAGGNKVAEYSKKKIIVPNIPSFRGQDVKTVTQCCLLCLLSPHVGVCVCVCVNLV